MKRARIYALSVAMIIFAGRQLPAAGLNVVEPDAFPSGTNITNLYPGVTLIAIGQSDTSVFSLAATPTSTGTRVFSNTNNGYEWGDGFNAGMRVNFAVPTNYVQIDIIGNDSSDSGQLQAYNSGNTLLGTFSTPGLIFGTISTASLSRPGGDIAYIIATGSASGADSISLDNLQYGAVPEPSTLMLLTVGCVALVARRRQAIR